MIIAITGLAGSGKSTVARMIGGVEIGFAEPLKRFCKEVFGFDDAQLYGPSSERERPSKTFRRPDGTPLTPRYALQTLGTEWGRNCDPDVWAKAGIARALEMERRRQKQEDYEKPSASMGWFPGHVVITDLRFVNEARIVREAGGQVWRVSRGRETDPGFNADCRHCVHASERDVWSPEMTALVTREIENLGTLDELRATVNAALAHPITSDHDR